VIACQPEEVWYGKVQPEHVDQLIDGHILGGEVRDELELSEDELVFVSREERPLPPIRRHAPGADGPPEGTSGD
jgi:(2Fe-2S) ferredoxin